MRAPEGSTRKPVFQLACGPAAGHRPVDLIVEDPAGRVLFRSEIAGRQEITVPGVFIPGCYYALRFRVERSGHTEASQEPLLLLSTIAWTSEEPGDAVQIFVEPSAASLNSRTETVVHLHTNGCGDFTLLAREHWMDLRGYPEFDLFSMNIDSVFCWAAHHGGAREEILQDPMRIYHIEHGTGSGWTPEGQQKLFQRIAAKGLSWLDYDDVLLWARIMNRFDAPMIFNHDDWGLAGEELKEALPLMVAQRSSL